jgi:hypothetical protein
MLRNLAIHGIRTGKWLKEYSPSSNEREVSERDRGKHKHQKGNTCVPDIQRGNASHWPEYSAPDQSSVKIRLLLPFRKRLSWLTFRRAFPE